MRVRGRVVSNDTREVLQAARTYYVRTDGSDSNDGSANDSSHAFLTIQKAFNVIKTLDIEDFTVTIQVGDGTYTGGVIQNGTFVGTGSIVVQGNAGSPSNVVISTTNADCFQVNGCKNSIRVKDLKMQTATSGYCLQSTAGSSLYGSNLIFGACANAHVLARIGGLVWIDGNYTISGSAFCHLQCVTGGFIYIPTLTITLSGTPAFTVFLLDLFLGSIIANNCTFSGSATGSRYQIESNSIVYTAGAPTTYFPGNAGGTTATGGQYL